MFDNPEYSFSCCPTSSELGDDDVSPFSPSCRKLTKKSSKNRRRFSDEQIKSLESMFKSETRLEPRKKVQLASDLGLQPRQVAIWFQNKRARWKSKQLERDYNILLANYNSLASRFDALKKEKQSLQLQLQKLNIDMKQKSGEEMDDHDKVVKCETSDGKPCSSLEKSEHVLGVLSDNDSNMKAEYFGLKDEQELLNMNMAAEPLHHEPADHSSPEDWGGLNSETDLFNESNGGYQWWDFWS